MWKNSNPKKEKNRLRIRGAISLFMVIILMPFITVAGILVEAGKYNSAVSIADEAMGVSATSTLANYDRYLRERWGLSALSQQLSVNDVFADNLEYNGNVLGKNLTFNKVSARGLPEYALSNNDLLKSQIYEFSKLNAPTKLASEFLDLSELVSALQDIGNLSKIADMAKSMFDSANKVVEFGQQVKKLAESAGKVEKSETDYNNKFNSFKQKVNEYIDSLKEIDKSKSKINKLQKELGALDSELDSLRNSVSAKQRALEDLQDKLKELEYNTEVDKDSEEYKEERKKLQKDIKEKDKELTKAQDKYDSKEKQVKSKSGKLDTAKSELSSAKSAASTKRQEAGQARADYINAISSVITVIGEYKQQFESCGDARKEMTSSFNGIISSGVNLYVGLSDSEIDGKISNIEKKQKDLAKDGKTAGADYLKLGKEKTQLLDQQATNKTIKNLNKATEKGIDSMEKAWDTTTSGCNANALDAVINSFKRIKQNVTDYNLDNLTSSSSKISTNMLGINTKYHPVKNVTAYVKAASLATFLENRAKELKESFGKFLNGMVTFINRMLKTKLFYDGNLSACINAKYYGSKLSGSWFGDAQPGTPLSIFNDVATIISQAKEAVQKFASLDFVKSWKAVKDVAKACQDFADDCGKFAAIVGGNVLRLFDYKKHYLTAYATWNLPCRTDALGEVGGKLSAVVSYDTMTGFKMKNAHLPTRDYRAIDPFGDLAAIVETLKAIMNETGSDYTFCGCELEYVLFGCNSEVANQLYTFCALYLIRLLPSTIAVLLNSEVADMASKIGSATMGIGALVVYIVLILAEPLVDTIILVNGGEVALYETTVHLTPSGIAGLLTEFVKIGLSTADKESLKNDFKEAYGGDTEIKESYKSTSFRDPKLKKTFKSWAEGLLKFDYRQYCYVALFLTLSDPQLLDRIRNLIQMETSNYYRIEGMGTFDIGKSYTYISADVDISVKQLMPSLTDSSLFRIHRTQYRGY